MSLELEPQPHECAGSACGLGAPQAFGGGAQAARAPSFRLLANEIPLGMAGALDPPQVHGGGPATYDSDVSDVEAEGTNGASIMAAASDDAVMNRLFGNIFRA